MLRLCLAAWLGCFLVPSAVLAQPTYKLGVGAHLLPSATLKIDGTKVTRSTVRDDPGFRLQYHFYKDGKSLHVLPARADLTVELPKKDPGVYSVVLEVFYPSYKGSNEQKGKFQAISPYLTYQVLAGNQIKPLEPVNALTVLCGKDKGKGQEQKITAGYGYKLVQGTAEELWPKAPRTHAWTDPKQVRFEVTVPAEKPGTLRLHFVDGDARQRAQKITVLGKLLPELTDFAGAGKVLDLHMTAQDTKAGKIDVVLDNINPTGGAAVSVVQWYALPK